MNLCEPCTALNMEQLTNVLPNCECVCLQGYGGDHCTSGMFTVISIWICAKFAFVPHVKSKSSQEEKNRKKKDLWLNTMGRGTSQNYF